MSGTGAEPRTLRTPRQPMAFTTDELLRGGMAAWVIFLILLTGATAAVGIDSAIRYGGGGWLIAVIPIVLLVAAPISGIVMVLGVVLARPIGHAMRRVGSVPLHLVVYSILGIAVALLYLTVVSGGRPFALLAFSGFGLFSLHPAISAAIAVPAGWWWTARRALREDAGLARRRGPTVDLDATVEDEATA